MSNNPSVQNDYVDQSICHDCVWKDTCGSKDMMSCLAYAKYKCPICRDTGSVRNNEPCSNCQGGDSND